jgi:hypothetical protein
MSLLRRISQRSGMGDLAKLALGAPGSLSDCAANAPTQSSPKASPRLSTSSPTTPRTPRSRAATDADLNKPTSSAMFVTSPRHLSACRFVDLEPIFKERNFVLVARYIEPEVRRSHKFLFVFGDNDIKKGMKGQATIRDCPNSAGVPTKHVPSNSEGSFYNDANYEANKHKIMVAIRQLVAKFIENDYEMLVIPMDGLGTGLAALPARAPRTYNALCLAFEMLVKQIKHVSKLLQKTFLEISGNTKLEVESEKPMSRRESTYARDVEVLEGVKASVVEQIMLKIETSSDNTNKKTVLEATSWKNLKSDSYNKRPYETNSMREDDEKMIGGSNPTEEELDEIARKIAAKFTKMPLK